MRVRYDAQADVLLLVLREKLPADAVEEPIVKVPQLTPAKLFDALSYYYDHTDEIEVDLKAQDLTYLTIGR